MNDITALALIAKIKNQAESYDTVVLREDEANVLVEALEKAQRHANLTEAERQAYLGLIAERDERIAKLEESHAQVIHARDHYKRLAGEGLKQALESRTVTVKLPDYRHERFWDCLGLEFNPVEYQAACIEMWREELTAVGINMEVE